MPELATLPGPAGSGSAIAWRAALGRREAWTEAAQRPLEPGAGALAAATRCAELGWIAGCLAPEVPRDSVRAALARTGLAEEDAATLFAAAERQGALQRQGERGAEAPDPETWLARELEPAPGLVALPLRSVGKGSKARCAEWDFTAVPCRTLGCVLGAWGEGCKAGTDELVLAERYVQLAPLSYSRLELAVDIPLGEDAQLVLDVQRGARPRLPEHGQAKLILTVEGRQLTEVETPKSNVGQVTWQLQVPAGRPARMSLRLSEDSDTTLRVLHARVVTALAGDSGSGQQPVVR